MVGATGFEPATSWSQIKTWLILPNCIALFQIAPLTCFHREIGQSGCDMKQSHTAAANPESGKEVAKKSSRYSAGFWLAHIYRPKYKAKDSDKYIEVTEWFARIQHGGRREAVGLGTNNREAASRKAANLYQWIRSDGWDKALMKLDPERNTPRSSSTVGEYILMLEPLFTGRPATWYHYTYSLRKIAFEIAYGQQEEDASKFDPLHKPWQEKANKIKLAVVTSQSIDCWKRGCLKRAGQNELEQQAAKRNLNSFMASARILFGKRMMRRLEQNRLEKPLFNPFEGVIFEDEGSKRYTSRLNAQQLLKDAQAELADKDPEAWKTILLALGAGLRRGEIDGLSISHIDFNQAEVRVTNTASFRAKTDSSEGVVHVDVSLLDELKKHLKGNGLFVIDSELPPKNRKLRRHYRCQGTFDRVMNWLRQHGVDEVKPLHTLRKEFGSIINAQSDIHTASRQLRHSDIRMTSDVYADNRRSSTVPVGVLLGTAKPPEAGEKG